MKKMIWAGMNPPSASDEKWAESESMMLCWHKDIIDILQIRDHKARAAKLRELADILDAGIITRSRRIVRDLEKEVEA